MTKAFVFGKFLPFHKGHEAMIHFALTKCDQLTVLVCCSDKETIPGTLRKAWIDKAFENHKNVEVRIFNYLESDLPNTSESSRDVSKLWADVFKKLVPGHSLVVTSEPYGDFVAEFMNIRHIACEISKKSFPISATAIRNNLFANWNYLPPGVKPSFAIKVVILGTESTGKTTLTEKLAEHFHCSAVREAGRDIIANSNHFSFDDLHVVAVEHARRIDDAVVKDSPLVIIDTDIHTTQSYARFVFQKELEVSDAIYHSNKADLYLYLCSDIDFVQDGTRLAETERNQLDVSHRAVLKDDNIDIVEISGSWKQRFEKAVEHIDTLLFAKGHKL